MILIPLSVFYPTTKKKKNKPTNSQKYKHNTWFVQLGLQRLIDFKISDWAINKLTFTKFKIFPKLK